MSVSPSTVVDIDVLALGARIMTRIQISLPLAAAIRADVATTLPWPCGPLATTELIVGGGHGIARRPAAALRGIGALAATIVGAVDRRSWLRGA